MRSSATCNSFPQCWSISPVSEAGRQLCASPTSMISDAKLCLKVSEASFMGFCPHGDQNLHCDIDKIPLQRTDSGVEIKMWLLMEKHFIVEC